MPTQVPLVAYLALGEHPHLIAHQCRQCGARFFDRRNACASCGGSAGFEDVDLPDTGVLRTFTIVSVAAPGVPVPYVAGLIDLAGTSVRANVVNVKPEPGELRLGMTVRLTTFSMGTDVNGIEAIGFGFEPVDEGVA
ncbi:OB-fold domain-containing protein [Dactylosporangium sp. AC04546]|uniref:Zn-ribbon domain-containing OB-fold protein n=1 Tax=Dactylosporangium sp. AC04546 TaxID=2862460 RepID=UPI001EDE1092|nr:OB-fold domain-containing protein [Dactylosporangium sp. AC04546]WVK86967.1 OB-fold domain-containing protein [Dactylosporangium sp. AC04546]